MTREEITKEAQEQVNRCTPYHTGSFVQGYITAVESWQAKYEKQKEINKELVDENEALKFAARMSEKTEKQLREQIEKMKCCYNCDNWHWKHKKCEKNLKGDCFKASKWILRR